RTRFCRPALAPAPANPYPRGPPSGANSLVSGSRSRLFTFQEFDMPTDNPFDFPHTSQEKPTVPMNTTAPAAPNPFDPAALRLTADFPAASGVKKLLLTVPVRKPDKSWFVRTHPSDDYRIETAVIELKEDRETYLVARPLWPELAAEGTFSPRALFTAMN